MAAEEVRSIATIAEKLVELIDEQVLDDLRSEDPVSTVELYFQPVGLRSLPPAGLAHSDCSVDGFYEASVDPNKPWILYESGVAEERVRFTVLHELGHHLLATAGADLLDDLDRIGGPVRGRAQLAEERVCHHFAASVLIPSKLLYDVIGEQALVPRHVVELRGRTNASWEAVAVRAANFASRSTAVAIVTTEGEVAFVASGGFAHWPRRSRVRSGGALDRALRGSDSVARSETYRFDLAHAEELFCDTTRVSHSRAVGVLSGSPSNRVWDQARPPDPAWIDREEFCQWCGNERSEEWCPTCSGQRCNGCDRCGCGTPVEQPLCSSCTRLNAFNTGASVCVDCEADGLG